MSEQMPTGWMDAETARKWARRGVWARRFRLNRPASVLVHDAAPVDMFGDEMWRYIGPHPDDLDAPAPAPAEAGETFTKEVWAVSWIEGDAPGAFVWSLKDDADKDVRLECANGRPAHVVRVVLTLPVPKPAPVLTVTATGEVCDG